MPEKRAMPCERHADIKIRQNNRLAAHNFHISLLYCKCKNGKAFETRVLLPRNQSERMLSIMEITLTKENYKEIVENANKPVLIDFWATWCGPCKMIAPIVEQVAEERTDITVCKVNVDEQEELAVKFGIQSIPTLVLVKNGVETGRAVGYRDYEGVTDFIDL